MLLNTLRKSLSAFSSCNIFNQYKNLYHTDSVSFHASTEKVIGSSTEEVLVRYKDLYHTSTEKVVGASTEEVVGASTEETLGFSTGCSSEYRFGVGIVIVTIVIHFLFLLWCLFLKHFKLK